MGVGNGDQLSQATDPQVEGLGNLYPHEPYKAIAAGLCLNYRFTKHQATVKIIEPTVLQTCPARVIEGETWYTDAITDVLAGQEIREQGEYHVRKFSRTSNGNRNAKSRNQNQRNR